MASPIVLGSLGYPFTWAKYGPWGNEPHVVLPYKKATHPCPCGYFGDLKRECRCGPLQVQRYRQRISGPLLDRIDLHIEVPAVEYRDISSTKVEEGSAAIRERVGRARERQRARFRSDKKVNCNARMGPRQIRQHCKLSDESQCPFAG
jgi:magnesium chelatase family protein